MTLSRTLGIKGRRKTGSWRKRSAIQRETSPRLLGGKPPSGYAKWKKPINTQKFKAHSERKTAKMPGKGVSGSAKAHVQRQRRLVRIRSSPLLKMQEREDWEEKGKHVTAGRQELKMVLPLIGAQGHHEVR